MNDTMNEEEIRNALDSIARNFQPSRRPAFAVLIPFKGQIRYLRSQRASFATIAKCLKQYSVETVGETVRRFYCTVIEPAPSAKKRRRRKAKPKQRSQKAKPIVPPKSRDVGEPRIARIEDL